MPTNEQRRQNARRKLERQLERRAERAKRRRQLVVTASVVVVVLVAGLGVGAYLLTRPEPAPAAAAPALCTFAPDGSQPAKPATAPTDANPPTTGTVPATITTSVGVVPITLDRSTGPCAVESFVSLASQDYFNDTPCHRLTTQGIFVLQCGDPTGTGTGGPGYTINDEKPTTLAASPDGQSSVYPRGTLAMAKTAAPDSGGSQFFLVYQDSPLPPDYSVFGTIAPEGLTVLDQVAAAGVAGGGADGKPATAVQLQTVTTQA